MKKALLPALFASLAFAFTHAVFAETIKKPELDKLASAPGLQGSASFAAFLKQAARMNPKLKASVAAYAKKASLAGDDLVNISRLLGLYNRLNNQKAVIAALEKMVAIPTVRADKIPQHENPAILEFAQLVEAMAKDFGLQYRNVDNRVFEVKLRGRGNEEFGILTHSDVVPVVKDEWVLPDGTRLDPFKLTRVGGNLYGRGSMDDKGSIATVLYAMKAVKESGLPIERTIRLMIETTEETGSDGIKYYLAKVPAPAYNIVLDSMYPAVVAEKGTGALKVLFPIEAADPKRTAITLVEGAGAVNSIPQTARATLKGGDLQQVESVLNAAKNSFVQAHESQGGKFTIDVTRDADAIVIKVTGRSGHGARPEEGVNPVPRLALFLRDSGIDWADNHYAKAVKYLNDLHGLGYFGEKMGVGYKDDFMGPLTMSPTFFRENAGKLEVAANVRMPRGETPDNLIKTMAAKVNAWAASYQLQIEIDHKQGNWMARDVKGEWLSTLLNIFGETTGLDAKPVPTAGSTTAKLMPNAVNFGPVMPGKDSPAHKANEYKEIVDLQADIQMFTEMLVRIGNLKQLQ